MLYPILSVGVLNTLEVMGTDIGDDDNNLCSTPVAAIQAASSLSMVTISEHRELIDSAHNIILYIILTH